MSDREHNPKYPKAYLTRKQLVQFLNEQGYPFSLSTCAKLCAPSRNEGPPMVGVWGKRALHDPDEALAWARSRMRSAARKI
jgi:hypothetical protein